MKKDDLISRAAALDAIDGMKPMQGNMEQLAMKALCWAAVKTSPPVDAAPVVRCRDCKYYAINHLTKAYEPDKRFNPSVCIIGEFARPRKPDLYCAYGERRLSRDATDTVKRPAGRGTGWGREGNGDQSDLRSTDI